MAKPVKAAKKFTAARAKVQAPASLTDSGASYFDTAGQAAETIVRAHAGARRHTEEVEKALAAEKEAHIETAKNAADQIAEMEAAHLERMTKMDRDHLLEKQQFEGKIAKLESMIDAKNAKLSSIVAEVNRPLITS
jgi:protein-tyrosine-phosphatase